MSATTAARGEAPATAPLRAGRWGERRRRRVADLTVGVLLLAVAGWRWSVLAALPGPVGVDGGNWLRLFRALLGQVDVQDVVVPPLVPLLAGLADLAVGPLAATRLLAAVAAVAPAAGAWWVLRRRWTAGRGAAALAGVLTLSLVGPVGAAAAWGGVPQLLGLGLLPVALTATAVAVTRPSRRRWRRAGAAAALVAITSTLATVLLACGTLAVLAVAAGRTGRRAFVGVRSALLPLTPVTLLYGVILTRMSLPDGRATAAVGLRALQDGLGAPTPVWLGLVVALLTVTTVALRRDEDRSMTLLLVGLSGAAVAGVVLGDVRFVAAVPTAVTLAATLPGPRGRPLDLVRGVALAGLVVLAVIGASSAARDVAFYRQFAPATLLDDAREVAARVPAGERVAVPPVAGAPAGWWLQALGVDAAVASRSDWLSFPAERAAAAEVMALFTRSGWPDTRVGAEACRLGLAWLYVPDRWGGMDPGALARETGAGRLTAVADLPGGVLLRSAAC